MFKLVSAYEPAGDQPRAIAKLTAGVRAGAKHRTVLGVTGSTKGLASRTSFKMWSARPLVILHNQTLAAQKARSN